MSELSRRDFLRGVMGAALAVILAALLGGRGRWTMAADMETTPQGVVNALTGLDTWILVQPKAVAPLPGESFDLSVCKGLVITDVPRELAQQAADRQREADFSEDVHPSSFPLRRGNWRSFSR